MTRYVPTVAVLIALLASGSAPAQSNARNPSIGYAYPAGAQRGTTTRIVIGGQFLNGVEGVHVTGKGVSAKLIKHYRPPRNINGDQRLAIQLRMYECANKRWDELRAAGKVKGVSPWLKQAQALAARIKRAAEKQAEEAKKAAELKQAGAAGDGDTKSKAPGVKKAAAAKAGAKQPPAVNPLAIPLPEHYLLADLDEKSLAELMHIRTMLFDRGRSQPNAQIAEAAIIEVTVDPDADAADREIRLKGRWGLTNPVVFQVGTLPEHTELEHNEPNARSILPKAPPFTLPFVINGQAMPGDVDRFEFKARKGQQLVIRTSARRLVPFLADAVPGWFQATVAVYDTNGREVAFADDFRFDPDPSLRFVPPADGVYQLEVRDAIYRGREDFVYRVEVGELPFITSVFPMGGRQGERTTAQIDGWNLIAKRLVLDTQSKPLGIHTSLWQRGSHIANPIRFAVSDLPESLEIAQNDSLSQAQRIDMPRIINGRITTPGDVDIYRVSGKRGDRIVAEVVARRLRSPMDALVRITDSAGQTIAWNDDNVKKDGHLHTDMGLLTHHADAYVMASLPRDGDYYIHVADAQRHGGDAYAYRLRVSHPKPDFALRVEPSSINVYAGRAATFTVFADRHDGYTGPIDVSLADAPKGFFVSGSTIPEGCDRIRMTLTAPSIRLDDPIDLRIVGSAKVGDDMITRDAQPCDDVMQAFLWRHLKPSQALMVTMIGGPRSGPPLRLSQKLPIRLTPGGSATVKIAIPPTRKKQTINLELDNPPAGVELHQVKIVGHKATFTIRAGADIKPTLRDNLIVHAWAVTTWKDRKTGKERTRRWFAGTLPAIPIVIVDQTRTVSR